MYEHFVFVVLSSLFWNVNIITNAFQSHKYIYHIFGMFREHLYTDKKSCIVYGKFNDPCLNYSNFEYFTIFN